MMKSMPINKKMNKQDIIIEGERIYLRILEEDDASEEYASWINDSEVNRYLETKKTTAEDLKKYIAEKRKSEECLFFGIFLKESKKHIGNIKLEPIDTKEKIATMGMMIGDKSHWGKGIATEALNILVDWAFNNLDIYEIDLGVLKDNAAAIKVYEKSGFKLQSAKETGFFMVKRKIKLALGTVQLGIDYGINNKDGKPAKADALKILDTAYENGIRVFDTAVAYGEAEEILGEFISTRHLEKKIDVISKLSHIEVELEGNKNEMGSKKEIVSENEIASIMISKVRSSLMKLHLNQLDGLLLHDPKQIYDDKIMAAMKMIKSHGLTRNIGVSVYDEKDALNAVKRGDLNYVQVPYNVFDHHLDRTDFFETAKKNKVTVFARSPFLQGLFLMEPDNIPAYLKKAEEHLKRFDSIINKYGLTRKEAALLFAYHNPRINYVVFGIDNVAQLEQNIAIINKKIDFSKCMRERKDSFDNIEKEITNPSLWKKQQ